MGYIQVSLFGRTSWERLQAMLGVTLRPCSRKSDRPTFQCLLLDDGQEPEWLEAKTSESHGERSMLNFGASPSTAKGSSLSRVLESGGGDVQVLFEPESMRGDTSTGARKREKVT